MFRWYGLFGILMVVFAEINFFLRVEPFATYYFAIVWLGYILIVDAVVYMLNKESLISNKPYKFIGLMLLSAIVWWVFEFINLRVGNWNYNNIYGVEALSNAVRKTFYFSTVIPAVFETMELIRSVHIFDSIKLHKVHNVSKKLIHILIYSGFASLILVLALPKYFYPLVWVCFFLILDPVNYIHKQPSIIGHLKDRKLAIPLSLLLAGIVCGFFWEFWNYWAVPKWHYNVPFVGFWKIFEMPVLGYLGYFPFALELYAMYYFVRSLFIGREKLLVSS